MSNSTIDANESIDVDDRARRALTQYLTVLPVAPDLFEVVSESGQSYVVDTDANHCTCPDHQYRDARCKHIRRVRYATGAVAVPESVPRSAIDDQLGQHVSGSPRLPIPDGGEREGDETPRAECWCADSDMPCFEHFEG